MIDLVLSSWSIALPSFQWFSWLDWIIQRQNLNSYHMPFNKIVCREAYKNAANNRCYDNFILLNSLVELLIVCMPRKFYITISLRKHRMVADMNKNSFVYFNISFHLFVIHIQLYNFLLLTYVFLFTEQHVISVT